LSLFYQPGIPAGVHYLDQDESRHATKVLRLRAGDALTLTDGKGGWYTAEIVNPEFPKCTFRILESRQSKRPEFYRHIAIAPTKNADRTEWFVEKAVELGIDEISFMLCQTSERRTLNLSRIEKIAVSAMKQSQQMWLPKLSPLQPFADLIKSNADQKYIAFVDRENPLHLKAVVRPGAHCLVLIGPEGDFSIEELQLAAHTGFQKVSLGINRLRTETAGLAACHILNLSVE
jgi:16S rRNA (uracil1498-N3)-methyltransferase